MNKKLMRIREWRGRKTSGRGREIAIVIKIEKERKRKLAN